VRDAKPAAQSHVDNRQNGANKYCGCDMSQHHKRQRATRVAISVKQRYGVIFYRKTRKQVAKEESEHGVKKEPAPERN